MTKYILTLFSALLLFTGFSQSIAPKYSNEFLSIGVGANALGLGNAIVANTGDVMSAYWNPAGLTRSQKWLDVGLMHSEYFAGIAKYDYLGLSHSIDSNSAVGFSAIRFGVDNIPNTTQLIDNNGNIDYDKITSFTAADWAFLFSYAHNIKKVKGLSVGGNVKIIYRKVGKFAKSWGFGLDAGVQYQLKDHWKFGAVLRDATSTFNAWMFTLDAETKEVFERTNNEIPQNGLELTMPRLILGAYGNYPLGKKGIYFAGEVNFDITTDGRRNTLVRSGVFSIDPKMGIEFGFRKYVAIRVGITNMQFTKTFDDKKRFNIQPNIGIGLGIKDIRLDYAFTNIGGAGVALYSHVISLRIGLNKPKSLSK